MHFADRRLRSFCVACMQVLNLWQRASRMRSRAFTCHSHSCMAHRFVSCELQLRAAPSGYTQNMLTQYPRLLEEAIGMSKQTEKLCLCSLRLLSGLLAHTGATSHRPARQVGDRGACWAARGCGRHSPAPCPAAGGPVAACLGRSGGRGRGGVAGPGPLSLLVGVLNRLAHPARARRRVSADNTRGCVTVLLHTSHPHPAAMSARASWSRPQQGHSTSHHRCCSATAGGLWQCHRQERASLATR